MAILFTGFDPFGGASVNPSWEAVQRLPDQIAGRQVHRLQLPTVYGEAAQLLLTQIRLVRPCLVISCGVASGREGVTPELVAINYRQARIPDNAGQSFCGTPVIPGGDTAYMTSLPVNAMIEALRQREIPAYLSLSAGAYVCNDVYYHSLHHQAELGYQALFVHVPDTAAVDADRAAEALAICAKAALGE